MSLGAPHIDPSYINLDQSEGGMFTGQLVNCESERAHSCAATPKAGEGDNSLGTSLYIRLVLCHGCRGVAVAITVAGRIHYACGTRATNYTTVADGRHAFAYCHPHSLSFSFLAPITSVVTSCERVRFPQQSAYRLLRTVFLLLSHIHYIHAHTTATVTCVYARQKDYHRDRLEVCRPCD